MMECRLAGETEVLGENLPQRHFCPSQNPTCPPGFEPGPLHEQLLSNNFQLIMHLSFYNLIIYRVSHLILSLSVTPLLSIATEKSFQEENCVVSRTHDVRNT
jgi:hypothetical protein